MRKIALSLTMFLAAILVVGLVFTSCKKDDFTEEDAINLLDDLNVEDYIAEYTVLLVDAASNNLADPYKKSATAVQSMEGALVTLTIGDERTTQVVDSSGMATFEGIPAGYAAVNIKLAGYSEVNYVVYLQQGLNNQGMEGGVKLSNILPMIPLTGTTTATLAGRVTYEADLTNTAQEPANGVAVLASVSNTSATLASAAGSFGIQQLYYGDLNMADTTDAAGNYSIVVPSTADGLSYTIEVLDFERTQNLLMPTLNGEENLGVYPSTTRFGSRLTGPSPIVEGFPAYIEFPAPNATREDAVAEAIIDSDLSIESVNVTNSGEGYNITANSFYSYVSGSNLTEDYAIIIAHLDNTFKRVTYVSMDANGENHDGTNNVELGRMILYEVSSVDVDGGITGITMVPGSLTNIYDDVLDETPAAFPSDYHEPVHYDDLGDVKFVTSSGSADNAEINFSFNNQGYNAGLDKYEFSINAPVIDAPGEGYMVGDLICFDLISGEEAEGEANVKAGSLTAISVTNPGSGYVNGQVTVLIEGGEGQDATASATVVNGKIPYITVTDPGFGYSTVANEAPDVVIINNVIPEQIPIIYIDRNDDGTLMNSYKYWSGTAYSDVTFPVGAGYITPVDVSITESVSDMGSGAEIAVQVNGSGQISGLNLINAGADYDGVNTPNAAVNAEKGTATVKGPGSYYRDIYLGTGIRVIEK